MEKINKFQALSIVKNCDEWRYKTQLLYWFLAKDGEGKGVRFIPKKAANQIISRSNEVFLNQTPSISYNFSEVVE